MRRPSLLGIIYLVIGVLVAVSQGYLRNIGDIGDLVSALLAIALWPLILLGFDINISGGGNSRSLGVALLKLALR